MNKIVRPLFLLFASFVAVFGIVGKAQAQQQPQQQQQPGGQQDETPADPPANPTPPAQPRPATVVATSADVEQARRCYTLFDQARANSQAATLASLISTCMPVLGLAVQCVHDHAVLMHDVRNLPDIINHCIAREGVTPRAGTAPRRPQPVEVRCPIHSHRVGDRFTGTCACDDGWRLEETAAAFGNGRLRRFRACVPARIDPNARLSIQEAVCRAIVHDADHSGPNSEGQQVRDQGQQDTSCSNAIRILDTRLTRVENRVDQVCLHTNELHEDPEHPEHVTSTVESTDCAEFNALVINGVNTATGVRREFDEHRQHPIPAAGAGRPGQDGRDGRMIYGRLAATGFGMLRFHQDNPPHTWGGGLQGSVLFPINGSRFLVGINALVGGGYTGFIGPTWVLGGGAGIEYLAYGRMLNGFNVSIFANVDVRYLTVSGPDHQSGLRGAYRGLDLLGTLGVKLAYSHLFFQASIAGGAGDIVWPRMTSTGLVAMRPITGVIMPSIAIGAEF